MLPKIPLLIGLGLSTVSLAIWSGFAFKDNYQYNSKMWEYEEWRQEFFKEKLGDETYLCHNFKNQCLNETNLFKQYLPSPYEDTLWEKLYKSLEVNRKNDKQSTENVNSYVQQKEQLSEVKNAKDLRNYCYGRVKQAIQKYKDSKNKNDFIVSNSGKDEERCVLGLNELKK